MQQNEDENIRLWLARDLKAGFELLVRTYSPKLYGRAVKKLKDPDAAQDIIQQVWLKAFISLKGFTTERILTLKVENWLQTIESSVFADVFAQRVKEQQALDLIDPQADADIEELIAENERHRLLLRAIELLSEKRRRVMFLRHILQYEIVEIAKILDIPEGTVKSHLARGKEELRQQLYRLRG